jgi:hypothetical protein
MAHHETQREGARDRRFVNALWIAAAVTVVTGFVLRSLSTFTGNPDVRVGGIVLIAIGLAIAVLGWIGERIVAGRPH